MKNLVTSRRELVGGTRFCLFSLFHFEKVPLMEEDRMFNEDQVKLAIAPIGWTNDDMPEDGS